MHLWPAEDDIFNCYNGTVWKTNEVRALSFRVSLATAVDFRFSLTQHLYALPVRLRIMALLSLID